MKSQIVKSQIMKIIKFMIGEADQSSDSPEMVDFAFFPFFQTHQACKITRALLNFDSLLTVHQSKLFLLYKKSETLFSFQRASLYYSPKRPTCFCLQ